MKHPAFSQPHHSGDDYTTWLIKFKASKLVGNCGFTISDREDLEQELALTLLQRSSARRHLVSAYVCMVRGCANMMGPPNTPPCTGITSPGELAKYGIAPPNSYHSGGANIGMMDGTVKYLTENIDLKIIHALGSPAGNEDHPWITN